MRRARAICRSLRAPSDERFERLDRDQPPTAYFDGAERSGGHELVEGGARKPIGDGRFVDLVGAADARVAGWLDLHRITSRRSNPNIAKFSVRGSPR